MNRTGSGAQCLKLRHLSREQYVLGWVCCQEPEYILSSSFVECFKIKFWFPLKYKLNQTFLKFRFSFTNGLTQRQTDLSRWWLIVLPKVKHVLKGFFAKSSLGGFYLQFYLQLWYI